jgi:hypothetical protein
MKPERVPETVTQRCIFFKLRSFKMELVLDCPLELHFLCPNPSSLKTILISYSPVVPLPFKCSGKGCVHVGSGRKDVGEPEPVDGILVRQVPVQHD